MKFHHYWIPDKVPSTHPAKIYNYPPPEKIFPTPMTAT